MNESQTKQKVVVAFSLRLLLVAMFVGILLALLLLWWLGLGFGDGKAVAASLATILLIGIVGELVRRRFRISLRILLVAFTVAAVLMGLYGRRLVEARKQQQVAAKIRRLGGNVKYDFGANSGGWVALNNSVVIPDWCTSVFGPDLFARAKKVNFRGNSFTDDDLELVRELPFVEYLDLSSSVFTAAALQHLTHSNIKRVMLNGKQATATGFTHLKTIPDLSQLILRGRGITDETLSHLQGPAGLKKLTLWETSVTDSGLTHLHTIERLEYLDINNCQVGDAGLSHVARLNSLRYLHLNRITISDAGIMELKRLTQLQRLSFSRTAVTNLGLEKLQESMPSCEIRNYQ